MEEIREKEKFRGNEIFMNPYVVQMDKFADYTDSEDVGLEAATI